LATLPYPIQIDSARRRVSAPQDDRGPYPVRGPRAEGGRPIRPSANGGKCSPADLILLVMDSSDRSEDWSEAIRAVDSPRRNTSLRPGPGRDEARTRPEAGQDRTEAGLPFGGRNALAFAIFARGRETHLGLPALFR
jgi:hypothetical protein